MAGKTMGKEGDTIQSVVRALDLLEVFLEGHRELGVTELSGHLGLPKNATFRLLATLEERGYVRQDVDSSLYGLGNTVLALRGSLLDRLGLRKMARPALEELAEASGETVGLGMLRGGRVIWVDGLESSRPVRVAARIGMGMPALACALGVAQVAFWSVAEASQLLPRSAAWDAGAGEVDLSLLQQRLAAARDQGYAVDRETCGEGVCCVGAPIYDGTDHVVASLSLSIPVCRFSDERLREEAAPLTLRAAASISASLGHRPGVGDQVLRSAVQN